MSRGLGYVQRTIRALIAEHPHGAWSTGDLCEIVYGGSHVTKVQRVAVTRAMRRMTLPGTWETRWVHGAKEYFLCDPCDLGSMSFLGDRFEYNPRHLKPGGDIYEDVERAKKWRDASRVERIDIQIADLTQTLMTVRAMGSPDPAFTKKHLDEIARLKTKRRRLGAVDAG